MPVRSLNSSVFKWPDRSAVDHAVRDWAEMAVNRPRRDNQVGVLRVIRAWRLGCRE